MRRCPFGVGLRAVTAVNFCVFNQSQLFIRPIKMFKYLLRVMVGVFKRLCQFELYRCTVQALQGKWIKISVHKFRLIEHAKVFAGLCRLVYLRQSFAK